MDGATGWTIVLESLAGATPQELQARRLAAMDLLNRNDVQVRTTKSGSALTLGMYPVATSPDARAALAAVRSASSGNLHPYAGAFFAPPPGAQDPGHIPELNLETARQTFGNRAVYTLQIAVYETSDQLTAKRAAEQAALQLRQEGQLAFYHHGRGRSVVTLGVFSDDDLNAQYQPASPALIQLMKQFPNNLLNGQYPIVERSPTGQTRTQTSMLVRIP